MTETTSPPVVEITQEGPAFEIPVLARYKLSSVFSVGLGGYYLQYVGSAAQITKSSGSSFAQYLSYADLNRKSYDYGAVGSFRAAVPMGIATSLVLEGRYQRGLAESRLNTSSGYALKFDDLQLFIGAWFGLR